MVMKKKKVLLVASEYAPGMIPFAATVINTLAHDDRFYVRCLCVNSGKKSYRALISDDARPVHIEYPCNKLAKLVYKLWPFRIIRSIERIYKEFSPDVVHYLTGDFTLTFFIMLHHKKEYFYTVHDLHPHESKGSTLFNTMLNKYKAWGYKKCRDNIDNLTTSSQAQLHELQQIYENKWCAFTHFPTLVTSCIQKGNVVPKELENVDDYILFFGNVNIYKGVEVLIDAYEKSSLSDSTTKLVIAGKGLQCKFSSPNIIRMNRFIDDDEVAMLFKKAKFVVYPYVSATMSGVFSLAFYFQKKVLASDIPFFKENEIANVTYFSTNDAMDLQLKLEGIASGAIQSNIDVKGYEKLYGNQALADSYYELYTQSK